MGLTETERHSLVAALSEKGWRSEGDTVWSPSRGLWFGPSHVQGFTLQQFRDVFSRRAERIETAKVHDKWQLSAQENRDVSCAAQQVLQEMGHGKMEIAALTKRLAELQARRTEIEKAAKESPAEPAAAADGKSAAAETKGWKPPIRFRAGGQARLRAGY